MAVKLTCVHIRTKVVNHAGQSTTKIQKRKIETAENGKKQNVMGTSKSEYHSMDKTCCVQKNDSTQNDETDVNPYQL